MSESMYYGPNPSLVKHMEACSKVEPEFVIRKSDDPQFLQFVKEVLDCDPVRQGKLYALYWMSKTFKDHHWESTRQETRTQMPWLLAHFELTQEEAAAVLVAWGRHHGRNPSKSDVENKIIPAISKAYKDAAYSVRKTKEKRKAKRNAKDRENYKVDKVKRNAQDRARYSKTKNPDAKVGRPPAKDGLRVRISAELADHAATPAQLRIDLDVPATAVRSCLFRMVKAGEVSAKDGMYTLGGVVQEPVVEVLAPVVEPIAIAPTVVVIPPHEPPSPRAQAAIDKLNASIRH